MRRIVQALILLLALSTHAFAKPLQTFKLDNGLTLIVQPMARQGVVAMLWYKVGSSDEPGGLSGISHALEHMMFKGTAHYPPNSYSKIIASRGGQENAMTTRDYTVYFAKLSAKHLPTFMQLEADRMQHLTIDDSEFKKEIKVVQEERRMRTDDNPQSLAYERLMALTHMASPYHHPVVGWMDDLQHMTSHDLKQWYDTWYTPNNATLVLVGNIEPQKALALTKQYFGKVKTQPLPKRKPRRESDRLGERQLDLALNAKLPLLAISYNTPSLITSKDKDDAYALEVLAYVLDGGDSARLSRELIRGQHLASQADASYGLYDRYDSAFMIFAIPQKTVNMKQLKQAVLAQVATLKNAPISKEELERIKNQVLAGRIYQKDSLFGQAMELGMLSASNLGVNAADDYIKAIEALTPEKLQRVAKRYLVKNNMSVVTITPKSTRSAS